MITPKTNTPPKRVVTSNMRTREDISNPWRHIPYDELLKMAGVKKYRGPEDYTITDLGNGRSRIEPTEAFLKWCESTKLKDMTEQENHIEKILTHPIETDEDYQRLGELVEDESDDRS